MEIEERKKKQQTKCTGKSTNIGLYTEQLRCSVPRLKIFIQHHPPIEAITKQPFSIEKQMYWIRMIRNNDGNQQLIFNSMELVQFVLGVSVCSLR